MTRVWTLGDRKKARVQEIRAGFARLRANLADFGLAHNGKFWICGSATTGRFHFDSDIDIIVDFDDRQISDALDFAETACAHLGLKSDVQPKSRCTEAFIEKIAARALLLP